MVGDVVTLDQFIVISKGSERVAEVGARFTLDAMPGKQMSIDAELRAGHIDHNEARRRRAHLARESQFFGSMDGAMKFVKGDAIAGIIVLFTNIVGGLVIGIVQRGMDAATAARTYTVLTIGEGLVSQIPALLISTGAGIIVTRVASEEEGGHLGSDIGNQIIGQPKALAIAAAFLALLAVVPGLPTVPFLVLAAVLGLVAWRLMKTPVAVTLGGGRAGAAVVPGAAAAKSKDRPEAPSPTLTPIAIDLAPAVSRAVLAAGANARLLSELVPALRERFFAETGIPLPAVRLRPDAPGLPEGGYTLRLNEVPMARGEVVVGGGLAFDSAERLGAMGIVATAAAHPDAAAAAWIGPAELAAARLAGVATIGPEEAILSHLLSLLRRYGHEFVGVQETQTLLEGLERTHPALVAEVVPKLVSPVLLADVLRRLAEESISLRNLREILGALAEWAPHERDPVALSEHVRGALRRQITHKYAGPGGVLGVYLLDPMIEETVRESIQRTPSGSYLALEPALSRDILAAIGRTITGGAGVILTNGEIRRFVRRLCETEYPRIAVISFQELSSEAQLQPLGRVKV